MVMPCHNRIDSTNKLFSSQQDLSATDITYRLRLPGHAAGKIFTIVILGSATAESVRLGWGQLLIILYVTPKLVFMTLSPSIYLIHMQNPLFHTWKCITTFSLRTKKSNKKPFFAIPNCFMKSNITVTKFTFTCQSKYSFDILGKNAQKPAPFLPCFVSKKSNVFFFLIII